MKKPVIQLKLSRRMINIFIILLIFGGVLIVRQQVARLQTKDEIKPVEVKTDEQKVVPVQAAGRGNPFVNFQDGADLNVSNEAKNQGAQPAAMASADFDSDGVADFVTADVTGNLKLFKGTDGLTRNAENPFTLTDKISALNISPDFLVAGDFNADGRQDVLAAAKNSNFLALLVGDGNGNFSAPYAVGIDGQISALEAGEIGRKDGQADVAVAFSNSKGAFVAVFEHPESAFKRKPEIFKLPAPANALAIGNLDEDFYADLAVASGNSLTIIHGRGQAYPWDLIPQSGITRPAAFVATRPMPFAISAMTVGRFGTKRGETLAILSADGNIYRLEPNRLEAPSNNRIAPEKLSRATRGLFLPADAELRNLAVVSEPQISSEAAQGGKMLIDSNEISNGKFGEFLQKKQAEVAEKYKQMPKKERDALLAGAFLKKSEYSERSKQAYLRSIAGKPSTLAKWTIETLISDASLASAAASNAPNKMLKVNVSSSNLDDLLLVDSNGSRIELVNLQSYDFSREDAEEARRFLTPKGVTLNVESGLKAVLPMRLNSDALSDLVVLRENSSVPSVVMTAPMNTFVVTSDNEDGDCQGANLCSLRNAITLANQTPGVDSIFFSIGSATIAPESPLPIIREGVTISGPVNGNLQPLVEISGTNLSGQGVDGLKIRTSNAAILGLAVNEFTSIYDPDTGSSFGGNGITIESTTLSPNNGNNFIAVNYLGTDKTGSLDKGNGGAGLNIFDADDNQISDNLISGNGNQQVRGVGIAVTAGNNNLFHGNIIGLNSLGTGKLGNSEGVFLTGANNQFGGDGAGQGNTVSGNHEIWDIPNNLCQGRGISIGVIFNLDTGEQLSLNNNLKGNRVGTNPAGTFGLGNCEGGISTSPYIQTNIGSITQNGRNLVSDNGRGGISCLVYSDLQQIPGEGGFCQIAGNNIGTDITGNIGISNDGRNHPSGFFTLQGVVNIGNTITYSTVGAPGGTTPNGACTGFCNLISGSEDVGFAYGTGLRATGYGTVGIFNNYIGTNQSGNAAIPNDIGGIFATSWFGATFIGGDLPNLPLGNVVSGNRRGNIGIGANAFSPGFGGSASILGNRVGTDVSGNFSLQPAPDIFGSDGIIAYAHFGEEVYIGSAAFEGRNIISGHKSSGGQYGGGNGIAANGYGADSVGGFIKIVNNLVGLNSSLQPLGNQAHGIYAGNGVQIGGTDQEANQIAYNGTNGRNFAGVAVEANSFGVTIRNNSIHDNLGLGIDLNFSGVFGEADGVTPNDCQDADWGANGLQNYPDLFAPVFNGNGTVSVEGVLRSTPRETFTLDFYASPNADPTDYGEGMNHIGSTTVTTLANGNVSFTFESTEPVPSNYKITATATDINGRTSEFSCAAGVCFSLNGKTVEEALEELGITCFSPIVVNVTTDAEDLDGDNPNPETRDGFCDSDPDTPDQQCSLRAAIQEANARFGINTINFAIPGAGVQTIAPESALPVITGGVRLNGSSQNDYGGGHLIKIDGSNTLGVLGLRLTASFSNIEGLTIVGFGSGISLSGANNTIQNCYVGVNANGTTAPEHRQQVGIEIDGGLGNSIGVNQANGGNVISNNVVGISIVNGSKTNRINNNIIGLDAGRASPLPNDTGIIVDGSDENLIGTDPAFPNLIAGNNFNGIVLRSGARSNRVSGNKIGSGGTNVFGNGASGVLIETQALNNIIGGNNPQDGNVIVGHNSTGAAGVIIADTAFSNNYVLSNHIGVEPGGAVAPNYFGVRVGGVGQFIGNRTGGGFAGNYISGNLHSGVLIEDNNNFVIGNFIGTNGSDDLGNGEHGILVTLENSEVNGTKIKNNLISGNSGSGIYLQNANQTLISENKIGTDSNANLSISNGLQGIYVKGSENQIGEYANVEPNIISGNGQNGIYVETGSASNKIFRNYIGTTGADGGGGFQDGLGNAESGIQLFGYQTKIKGNVISANERGIRIERGADDPEEANNQIEENYIGTDFQGINDLGNRTTGILLTNRASLNFIRNGNVISGNDRNGVSIRTTAHNNSVSGNIIGLNMHGADVIANEDYGVFIEGFDNTVNENVISGNGTGIRISRTPTSTELASANNNEIWGNKIGTNSAGTEARGNRRSGIELTGGAVNNTIGGTFSNRSNLISGNGDGNETNGRGIHIFRADADSEDQTIDSPIANKIFGNYIGSNAAHDAAIPNQRSGILIVQSPGNIIGNGVSENSGNVIVGNLRNGIAVVGADAIDNRIDYNYIGVTREGTAIGNSPDGINIDQSPQTIIGNNNICGNEGSGIAVSNVQPNPRSGNAAPQSLSISVFANKIGVFKKLDGELLKIPNGGGIKFTNVTGGLIGSTSDLEDQIKNLISGNNGIGVKIFGGGSNQINHSIIGTDEDGKPNIGNLLDGIDIEDSVANLIGKVNPNAQTINSNVIAGNGNAGVLIRGALSVNNQLVGNRIGVAKRGGLFGILANQIGVVLQDSTLTSIGLPTVGGFNGQTNIIGGNLSHGLKISNSDFNQIFNNFLGTDETGSIDFGNGGNGVLISENSEQNEIGNPQPDTGNTIAFNDGAGVFLDETAGTGNLIDPNRIYRNGGLGIDLGTPGHTPNDPLDADAGANNLQNYPVITNQTINGNGDLIVAYKVDSMPGNSDYGNNGLRIEFFKADNSGEGERFLNADYYTPADYNSLAPGNKTFNLGNASALGFGIGDKVTATASDADGNTSEFFPPAFAPTAAHVTIGGQIAASSGQGIGNVRVILTDSNGLSRSVLTNNFGRFQFNNVEVGEIYVVGVAHKKYQFEPSSQIVRIDDARDDLNFTASP